MGNVRAALIREETAQQRGFKTGNKLLKLVAFYINVKNLVPS